MHRILILSVLSTGAVFLGLTIGIIVNKAWRESRQERLRRRRLALEPGILAYAHGEHASLLPALEGQVRRADRRAVESLLLDHVQRVRGVERERLGRALDELGYVDEYLAGLGHRRWWRRAEAAEQLGLAHASRAVDDLSVALHDEVHEVRLRAAKSLGALGGVTAVRPLIAALGEPNRWSTIRVADILTSIGPEVAVRIIEVFPGLNLNAKLAALDILAGTRSLEAAAWLRERLRDVEPDVRARACAALGAIDGPEAGPALTRALGDPQWAVRAVAARALGRIRHEPAIPHLCGSLRDREWWVRANASEALREMGEPGIQALHRMLDDIDGFAREQAVLRLEEAGVLDDAVAHVASGDPERREAARVLVLRVAQVGQLSRLRDHARRHPDPRVRESLRTLLSPGAGPVMATP
jgi:HEAT repeat protein